MWSKGSLSLSMWSKRSFTFKNVSFKWRSLGQGKRVLVLTWQAYPYRGFSFKVDLLFLGAKPLFWNMIRNKGFRHYKIVSLDHGWKRTNLENELKWHVEVEILLPWPTDLCFETNVFERVWPPHKRVDMQVGTWSSLHSPILIVAWVDLMNFKWWDWRKLAEI